MQVKIAYQFESAPQANRFLNELTPWTVADVKARLHRSDNSVSVTYQYSDSGFDSTAAALDDLAGQYGGSEIN